MAIHIKAEHTEILRDNWDFHQCPEGQLDFCLFYEYCRDVALQYRAHVGRNFSPLLFYVENFIRYYKSKRFQQLKAIPGTPIAVDMALRSKSLFAVATCTYQGFPDTPFLQIPNKER